MKRVLALAASSLVCCGSAQAAIVVHRVTPAVARPGALVRVYAGGYLGPKPWPAHPIVLVPLAQVPEHGIEAPTTTATALTRPPFVLLGSIARWRAVYYGGEGVLTARVPAVAPGRYAVLLFCEQCAAGPLGSLLGGDQVVLRVR